MRIDDTFLFSSFQIFNFRYAQHFNYLNSSANNKSSYDVSNINLMFVNNKKIFKSIPNAEING